MVGGLHEPCARLAGPLRCVAAGLLAAGEAAFPMPPRGVMPPWPRPPPSGSPACLPLNRLPRCPCLRRRPSGSSFLSTGEPGGRIACLACHSWHPQPACCRPARLLGRRLPADRLRLLCTGSLSAFNPQPLLPLPQAHDRLWRGGGHARRAGGPGQRQRCLASCQLLSACVCMLRLSAPVLVPHPLLRGGSLPAIASKWPTGV